MTCLCPPCHFLQIKSLCPYVIIVLPLPQCWGEINSLQWRHNGRDAVSNHQPYDFLLNCLFKRRSKKTSKLRVTGLCAVNSPVTNEFPAGMASDAENVSIWWRHHVKCPTAINKDWSLFTIVAETSNVQTSWTIMLELHSIMMWYSAWSNTAISHPFSLIFHLWPLRCWAFAVVYHAIWRDWLHDRS